MTMNRDELIRRYGMTSAWTIDKIITMHKDAMRLNLPTITSAVWVLELMGLSGCGTPPDALRSRILRIKKKASNLRGHALEAFRQEQFTLPQVYLSEMPASTSTLASPSSAQLRTSPQSPPTIPNGSTPPSSSSTDTGESFCLGWSSVVSETGKAISEEAQDKLKEVAGTSGDDLRDMLKKLEYFMNDRAANERKSSKLLEEWREETLRNCGEEDIKKVHHLFCAAHVLLGFHNYVLKFIKKSESFVSHDLKHPISVMLKDAADIFGPVGDYRGLRNQWKGFCMDRGINDRMKNYKDNRFNGLFEVSAQVFHHHHDFLFLLKSQSANNAKQARLRRALDDPKLILLAECLGLFFHAVTGPFWTMVTTCTTYNNFKSIIHKLKDDFQKCSLDPSCLFDHSSFSYLKLYKTTSSETKASLSTSVRSDEMKEAIVAISSGLHATLEAQLQDFLEGGVYTSPTSEMPEAPLTNLISERHFGHLDASQKRRPHCSLHHHSSVILLKQTRKRLRGWYDTLADEEKYGLWKTARTESGQLRRKHRQQDERVIMESLKLRVCEDEQMVSLVQDDLKDGQMIAVACQDAWYPAEVKGDSQKDEAVTVSFAEIGKGLGSFRWPTGKDVHEVSRKSIVEMKLDVEPRAGGRFWAVVNAKDVQKKFKKFK